jgi:hypothetical protein
MQCERLLVAFMLVAAHARDTAGASSAAKQQQQCYE